jgi:hypothetical protein
VIHTYTKWGEGEPMLHLISPPIGNETTVRLETPPLGNMNNLGFKIVHLLGM